MKPKGHTRSPFANRANLGHSIDEAMKSGNSKKAIELMRQSERRLTLKRRKIGQRERTARTPEELATAQAEMDAINDVMDDLCFHLRDPKGYHAKHK